MSHTSLRAALAASLSVILSALTPIAQCLVTKLTADDAQSENQFGQAVAIQGDEIFVGSPRENLAGKDSGSVHVLRRSGLHWFLKTKLEAPDARERLEFGSRLAVDERTLVVASGLYMPALYVYEKVAGSWELAATLPGPVNTLRREFGYQLAVQGDWIFAGAPGDSSGGQWAGAVFLFHRTDSGWAPAGEIVPSDVMSWDRFGSGLAAAGDVLVVGSPAADTSEGAAYVFERSGSDWIQRQRLTGEGRTFGFGGFGGIAIQDDTIAILGDPAVFVYERSGATWTQTALLTTPQPTSDSDYFGRSVALTDEHVLVSTLGFPEGTVLAFRRGNAEWSSARLQPDDVANGWYQDNFGSRMATSGNLAVVGAWNSSQRASGAGAVYVYDLSGSTCATLSSPREFSWGKQRLEIDRGPEHAGHTYRLLGSLSGTSRGIAFRGTRIPLNLDRYFIALLRTPQRALFPVSGVLDANGRASLVLQVPPTLYPHIVGLTLDHAFVERGPLGWEHVSNPVQVRFGELP